MNKSFPTSSLEDKIRIKHGFAFKGEYFAPTGKYIVLTPGNIYPDGGFKLDESKEKYYHGDFPGSFIFEKGDLVIVMTDLTQEAIILGGAFLIPASDRFLHNQRLGKIEITDDNKLDKKFLYYCLNFEFFRGQVRGSASGTTVKHTAPERIYKCKIPIPPLPTQQRVASILSAYDDLIEINNQRMKLLEQTARELYKEWFVRMRFPGYKEAKFHKGVPISEGEVIYFKDFIKLNRGFDLPEDKIVEGQYPIVASTSIKAYHNQFKVKAPIVATGRSGSIGKVQYVNQDGWPLNTSLYVKDFKGNEPLYVYYTLIGIDLESFDSGAGVPTLNQNHLHKLKIWVASKDLQNKFKLIAEPIFQQIETLQQQNTHLRQIRDRLLPRLVSGKLRVDVDDFVEGGHAVSSM